MSKRKTPLRYRPATYKAIFEELRTAAEGNESFADQPVVVEAVCLLIVKMRKHGIGGPLGLNGSEMSALLEYLKCLRMAFPARIETQEF